MAQMEHALNVYAAKKTKDYVAHFLGYADVAEEDATPRITPGLWLVRGRVQSTPVMVVSLP